MAKIAYKKRFKALKDYEIKEKVTITRIFGPNEEFEVVTPKFEILPQKHNIIEVISELCDSVEKDGPISEINIRLESCLEDITKVDIIATATIS